MPMEPRGVLAVPNRRGGEISIWASTQVPHLLQRALTQVLDLPAEVPSIETVHLGFPSPPRRA